MSLQYRTAALIVALGLILATEARAGSDFKPVSSAACQPMYSKEPVDPALLRFRPEGITNYYNTPKFVICPIPKDAELPWNEGGSSLAVYFRQEKNGASFTNNACSLTVGSKLAGTLKTKTVIAIAQGLPDYGQVLFDSVSGPDALFADPATLVCQIAPLNTLEWILLSEDFAP